MVYAFWSKKGKRMPFDKGTVDFVESDVADFPNSFKNTDRDAGFSWYEYVTHSGTITNTNLDNKVINWPKQAGIIRGRKKRKY